MAEGYIITHYYRENAHLYYLLNLQCSSYNGILTDSVYGLAMSLSSHTGFCEKQNCSYFCGASTTHCACVCAVQWS